jgi:hypothetical protein
MSSLRLNTSVAREAGHGGVGATAAKGTAETSQSTSSVATSVVREEENAFSTVLANAKPFIDGLPR